MEATTTHIDPTGQEEYLRPFRDSIRLLDARIDAESATIQALITNLDRARDRIMQMCADRDALQEHVDAVIEEEGQ